MISFPASRTIKGDYGHAKLDLHGTAPHLVLGVQVTYVSSEGWFDIGVATGRSLYRLPLALRDRDEGRTHVACHIYDDPWVNPRSGGVIGHKGIAVALGRSLSQVQRSVFDTSLGAVLRWVDGVLASNVTTLQLIREVLDARAHTAHREAGQRGGRPRKQPIETLVHAQQEIRPGDMWRF